MRRALSIALALLPLTAGAQSTTSGGFALDRFEPTPSGDEFVAVPSPFVTGHLRIAARLVADYAHEPLVLRERERHVEYGTIVSRQLVLRAGASVALVDRLLLSLDVPFIPVNAGEAPADPANGRISSPDGAALGDVRLGARVRLVGSAHARLQLGASAQMWAPTGTRAAFTSDGRVRALAALHLGGALGQMGQWSSLFGYMERPEVGLRVGQQSTGDELVFGGAVAYAVLGGSLSFGPEIVGSTRIGASSAEVGSTSTNLEALFGARWRRSSIVVGAAPGIGLTVGAGTPSLRGILSVAYAPPAGDVQSDADGDGIADAVDACPTQAGVADPDPAKHGCPADRDQDRIPDTDDACPEVAGVRSRDPRINGCPPDRDRDGISDALDACPTQPGAPHENPAKNGCPPDRDDDGIVDREDACPDVPGVRSDTPNKNGCPPDRDGDGINDVEDACPRESGPRDPDPRKNGCPTLVRVTDAQIIILRKIHFEFNKARIMADSSELLGQVAQVLTEHPEIKRVFIEGHTDDKGGADFNLRLSQRRAEAVRTWLVEHGISLDRLEARGFGKARPVTTNATEEGRERNRRVEFHIGSPSAPPPEGGAADNREAKPSTRKGAAR